MYVVYDIIIPTKLTTAQKRLIKELATTDLADSSEFKNFNKFI